MLIINILGIALIGFIAWWFWFYKSKNAVAVTENLSIRVEKGVYQPSQIEIPANQATTLHFLRIDETPCAETLIFPELEIIEDLPLNKTLSVELPALAPGKYNFHCQMQMYRGVVIAK
jgi:plastocyanin domain-containing protein